MDLKKIHHSHFIVDTKIRGQDDVSAEERMKKERIGFEKCKCVLEGAGSCVDSTPGGDP